MTNSNDKFIRDTKFGRLMESRDEDICIKCKHYKDDHCIVNTNSICINVFRSLYFAKEEEVNEQS